MLSFDAFIVYYQKYKRCPNTTGARKRPLNEREIKTAYERYRRSEDRKIERRLEKGKDLTVDPVGPKKCAILSLVRGDDWETLHKNAGRLIDLVDRAHVFGKGAYPWMRYDRDNVVWLNRWSHRCLDNGQDPITGKMIAKEEIEAWWRRIVGDARYDHLLARSKHARVSKRRTVDEG